MTGTISIKHRSLKDKTLHDGLPFDCEVCGKPKYFFDEGAKQ